jgi:hypothetical protein
MPTTFTITIDSSVAQNALASIRGVMGARESINKVVSFSSADLVRNHLLARNSLSVRSNYWSQAAEATTSEFDASSATVRIRHPGIAWHRFGGTITARPGKALAIPLRDTEAGVWPSERFPNKGDAFVWRKGGKAFLATRDGNALRILYILLKSVSKTADPSVLPTDDQIRDNASAAIRNLLRSALRRQSA